MAVAFDAKTAAWTSSSTATLSITNLTVGVGSNTALVCHLLCGSQGVSFPAALALKWDSVGANQTLTQISCTLGADGGLTGVGACYGLLNPAAGNKTLSISWTGNNEMHACALSFTGVDQTSIAVAFPHGANHIVSTAAASPCTVTITSATGNMTTACHAQNVSAWGAISGTTLAQDSATGPNLAVAGNYANGAATVTMTAAFTGTSSNGSWGCDVLAAASAAGTPYNPWPQLGPVLAQKRRSFSGWDVHRTHRWRSQRGLLVPNRKIIKRAA